MTTIPPAVPARRRLAPTLAGYRRSWLRSDILAGLSAGAVVIPQAMAYATIANLPVQVGLYTCIVPMLVYVLLGGSRTMSVSTTSTVATLTATTLVTAGVAAGSDDAVGALAALTLLVGIALLIARLLKLGALVENISQATVLGLKIGVGATVAVGQLPKLLGETDDVSGHGFFGTIVAAVEAVPTASLPTVVLSAASVLTLLLLGRFAPRVPGSLVVTAAGILLVWLAHIDAIGVPLIAPVPSGLPAFVLPDPALLAAVVPGALAIAVMVFLESAAVARGMRKPGDPQIDSDDELLAAGAGNVVGALFGAMPSAGGFSQSAVNDRAGAKSQVAALVTVVLAVLVAVLLGPVLSLLPEATLAAMVFVAVVGLIDIPELIRWWSVSRLDFWVAVSVAVVGLAAGLLVAVAFGVLVTLLLVLRELNRPRLDDVHQVGAVLAVRLGRGLYTANVLAYQRALITLVRRSKPPARTLVLDVAQLTTVTITVLDALADLDRELAQLGVTLHLAALPASAADVAEHTAWFRGVRDDGRVHPSVDAALRTL